MLSVVATGPVRPLELSFHTEGLERFIQERQLTPLGELDLAVTALGDLRGSGETAVRELVQQ